MKKMLMMCAVALGMAGVSVALGADYTTSRVISVNIRGGNNADVATDSAGLVAVPAKAWNNYQTINTNYTDAVTWDGGTTVTLSPNWTVNPSGGTIYYWISADIESILRTYIDDWANKHAQMIFSNVPFSNYDVYIYMAADGFAKFSAVSTIIDGETTSYTCGSDGIAFEGTAAWGQSQQLKSAAGTNVIIIRNQSAANITIDGGTRGTTRGAIAAVQLVESSPVVWGNVGSASEKGVATITSGGGYTTFDVDFRQTDNISQTHIGGSGKVCIKKIRLFRRMVGSYAAPSRITISQGDSITVDSTSVTTVANQRIYGPGWPTQAYDYFTTDAFDATFDSQTEFDTKIPIKLTFPYSQLFMIQPANSVMKTTNNWSPAIEITGVYAEDADPKTYTTTLNGTQRWSELEWTPALPTTIHGVDKIVINVTGTTPTLLMDTAYSTKGSVTFSGGAVVVGAADELYEDGCWQKDILSAGCFTAASGLTFPALKEGFVGAYSNSGKAITLRAQNKEVISINIAGGYSVSGTDYTGLAPVQGNTWMNMTETWGSGGRTVNLGTFKATPDGSTVTTRGTIGGTCYAANTYGWNTATDVFLKGFLDDGGTHALVTVTNIPYSSYDVIVYRATDSGGYKFAEVTLNGTQYTYDNANPTVAKEGTDKWGQSQNKTAVYGTNALRIRNIKSSTLTIDGGANASGARGCIAAIQIVCTGDIQKEHNYTATISSNTAFGDISWEEGMFQEGVLTMATITIDDSSTDEVVLTFDNPDITLKTLTIISKRPLKLVASRPLENVAAVNLAQCTGKITQCMQIPAGRITYSQSPDVLFDYAHTGAPPVERGTLEYRNANIVWGSNIGGNWLLKVTGTDSIRIDTAAYSMRPTFNMDISGGSVTFDPEGKFVTAWYGNNGQTTYKQTGGEVRFNITGTSQMGTGTGLLLGYVGVSATPLVLNISGGLFAVENSSINLWNSVDMNVTGGRVRAKGVFKGGGGTHTIDVASGATFELGSLGWRSGAGTFTLGGTLRAFEDATMENAFTYTDGARLTAASGHYLLIKSAIAGAGMLTCGDAVDDGDVVFVGVEPPAGIAGTYYLGYTVTINDCGKFKIPEGKEWDEVLLFDASGKKVPITGHDATYVYFDWKITGDACWWDYEFNGDLTSSGRDKTTMNGEGTPPYYNTENTALWVGHATSWRSVAYPTEFTAVFYGTVVSNATHVMMGFGSSISKGSSAADPFGILLVCGDSDREEVKLLLSTGFTTQELATMTIPDVYVSNHLYTFLFQTVIVNNSEKTRITIYLDGRVYRTHLLDSVLILGNGFQIGGFHGGVPEGCSRATTANERSFLDFLRLYNETFNTEAMVKYATLYPYISKRGFADRTFSGRARWVEDLQWRQVDFDKTEKQQESPNANTVVYVRSKEESEVVLNLSEEANYAELIIEDGAAVMLRKGDETPSVAGVTTVGADLTADYDAIILDSVEIKAGKTLTFDFSTLDLSQEWADRTIVLAKMVSLGEGASIRAVNIGEAVGRRAEFVHNESTGFYELRIFVDGKLTANLTGDTAFEDLVWTIDDVVVKPDWNKNVHASITVLTDGSTLTFAKAMESHDSILSFSGDKALKLAKDERVTVEGITYDFSGLDAKATFAYNPDPSKVQAVYVRYDLDMGSYAYDEVLMSAGGRYEFKKIRIYGNGYDYHDRTVVVRDGDSVQLCDDSNLGCGLSLDVRGGELHMGRLEGASYVSYGLNGTCFNQSGGIVTVHANGTAQTGISGFVLAHSATGGGCHEFNITGGVFEVPESSICFHEAANTINVSGTGILRAKGVFSSMSTSTGVVNVLEGGTFEFGSLGIAANACTINLNGGTLRGYEDAALCANKIMLNEDSMLAASALTHLACPLTIDNGRTLTIDATGGDIVMTGSLSNNGLIRVVAGDFVLLDSVDPGAYETSGTGRVVHKTAHTVVFADCGKFRIPSGKKWDEILLFDANQKIVKITGHDDEYIYFDWTITGKVCWWDYEFNQAGGERPKSIGVDTRPLDFDGRRPAKLIGKEYVTNAITGEISLLVTSGPWRNLYKAWPSNTTFVTYGTAVCSNNAYMLCVGTKRQGCILFFMRDADKGAIDVCYSKNDDNPTVLGTIVIPTAKEEKHLYTLIITNGEDGNTVVRISVDGRPVCDYTHSGRLDIGSGFQIASIHGGAFPGYGRPCDDDPAFLDWFRVYDFEFTANEIKRYAELYPFVDRAPTVSPKSGTVFDTSLTISMSCETEGATIHYTLDGSEPTMESPAYSKKFRIYERTVVKAVAFLPDGTASKMAVAEYATGRCDDPVISPPDGTVFEHSGQSVSIRRTAEDGVLRYTIDGSDPTAESPEYVGPFATDNSIVVKAKAFGDLYFDSNIVTATLTRVWVKLAMPVITADETFTGTKNKVVMSCANEGATIYYTLDGSEPTSSSLVYSKPFCVTEGCTIKAKAVRYDYTDSDVAEKEITREWGIGQTMGKPDHSFETSGDAGFVRVVDETAALGESMQSGEIKNSQTSILSTVVVGPGKLSFKWKTSCEYDEELHEWDHAEFVLDGDILEVLDGETNWQSVSCDITGDGPHTVIWRYVKDESEFEGEDCLWVSEYVWESDYVTTQMTGVPVPYLWLEEKCSDVVDEFESYEKVAKQKALNKRLTVEQCYVAGVEPESLTQDFTTSISMEGGFPTVTWDPDLGVLREYKVWGRESLMSGDWQYPTNSTHRFFKVTVEMK